MAKTKKGVRLEHISKIYKDPKTGKDFYAVKDANLEITPGSFVTLLGPSGCGKTTTLRMIAGFESPDEGEIYLGGEPINALTPNKRDTAMVFQSYALLPHYNIYDNVAYGLKLRKLDKATIKEKVTNILKLVGLEGMEARMTNQLSGGQQQRVALARALVLEPGVLLFDVTHDQSEAMALSDQIIIMEKGVVSQIGTPQEIYYHPANEFVADFIGEANFLRGTLSQKQGDKGVVVVEGTSVDVTGVYGIQQGNGCTLVLRPESAVLSDRGQLPCKVIVSCFMGAYQNYHVMVGNTMVKITDFNPKNKKIYRVGDTAYVAFEKENIHVL